MRFVLAKSASQMMVDLAHFAIKLMLNELPLIHINERIPAGDSYTSVGSCELFGAECSRFRGCGRRYKQHLFDLSLFPVHLLIADAHG